MMEPGSNVSVMDSDGYSLAFALVLNLLVPWFRYDELERKWPVRDGIGSGLSGDRPRKILNISNLTLFYKRCVCTLGGAPTTGGGMMHSKQLQDPEGVACV
jgi:hypothetical protein